MIGRNVQSSSPSTLSAQMRKTFFQSSKNQTSPHDIVSKHPFINNLMRQRDNKRGGSFTLAAYHDYLVQLLAIYDCLEQRLQGSRKITPVIKSLFELDFFIHIFRSQAIVDDLASIEEAQPHLARRVILAETQATVAHLNQQPAVNLVAHVYARYFGDLSGGRQLRGQFASSVKRHGCADAINFFHYQNSQSENYSEDNFEGMKDAMRAVIDTMESQTHASVCKEVLQSANMLLKIFNALQTKHYPTLSNTLSDTMTTKQIPTKLCATFIVLMGIFMFYVGSCLVNNNQQTLQFRL